MRGGHANAAEFEMQQQQAEALANLATATAVDRQAVAEIFISNATLTHELRTKNSNNHNTATSYGKLCVRSNAKDTYKRTAAATGKPTTPAQSKPQFYATGSRWILLVTWLSRQ